MKAKQLLVGFWWAIGLLLCPRQRQITPKSLVKLLRPNLDRGEETVRDDLRHVILPLYLPTYLALTYLVLTYLSAEHMNIYIKHMRS